MRKESKIMTNTQKTLKFTTEQILGIETATRLIAAAEKYPSADDKTINLLSQEISWNVSTLKRDIKPVLEIYKEEREKLEKKYKPYLTDEGQFKKEHSKEQEEFQADLKKLLKKEHTLLVTVFKKDDFKDFKMSFQVYDLLYEIIE